MKLKSSETSKPVTGRWQGAGIFCLALGVRLFYLVSYLNSPLAGHYRTDHQFYRDWGLDLAQGTGNATAAFTQGPLYAYFLGFWYWLFDSPETLILTLQAFAGSGTCLLIYASAQRLFTQRVALIAGVLTAGFGPLVFYDIMLMKTFFSPFFTALILYSSLRFREQYHLRWLWLAGISIGLAVLVRENHILLMIPVLLFLWQNPDAERASKKICYQSVLVLISACVILLAPVTIRNALVTGEFVAVTTGGGEVFYMAQGPDANGYYSPPPFIRTHPMFEHEDFRLEARQRTGQPALSPAECSRYWFWQGMKSAAADPLRSGKLTLTKLQILLNDYEVPDSAYFQTTREWIAPLPYLPTFGLFSGLGCLGLIVSFSRRKQLLLPLGLLLVHIISILLIYNFGRFRAGMLPLWMLFSAVGIDWLWTAWTRPAVNRWPRLAAVPFVILMTLFCMLPQTGRIQAGYPEDEAAYDQFLQSRQQILQQVNRLKKQMGSNDTGSAIPLASALMQLERFKEARDLLLPLADKDPDNLQVQKFLGSILTQTREWQAAIAHLEQAHKLDPQDAEICNNLGSAYEKAAETSQPENSAELFNKAARYWQKALSLDPQSAFARYNLARNKIRLNQDSQALADLNLLLEEHPGFELAEQGLEPLVISPDSKLSAEEFQAAARSLEQLARFYEQTGRKPFQKHALQLAEIATRRSKEQN
ncbi:glycosyltransferase family 39 protein [Gimesia sp.]|uniref:glycosyltransferase family 39 protein n=1 Tax=Gimesia sp. TaxID=2024833 RepID=UPI003A8D94E6